MKPALRLCFLGCIYLLAFARPLLAQPAWQWAQAVTGTIPRGSSQDMKRLPNGNLVWATAVETTPWPSDPQVKAADLVLHYTDPAGNALRDQRFGGPEGRIYVSALDVDTNGNVYVLGWFYGGIDFGTTVGTLYAPINYISLTSERGTGFLLKLNAASQPAWAIKLNGYYGPNIPSHVEPKALVIDSNGDPVIAGYQNADLQIDGQTLVGTGGFIIKLTTNGSLAWGQCLDGGPACVVHTLVAGPNGSLLIGGSSGEDFVFPNGNLPLMFNQEFPFIAQLSVTGQVDWARRHGNIGDVPSRKMVVFPDGRYAFSGVFPTQARFGTTTYLVNGNDLFDTYTASYSAAGNLEWASVQTSRDNKAPKALVAGADGGLYTAISHNARLTVAGQVFPAGGADSTNTVLLRYSPAGNLDWAVPIAQPGQQLVNQMALTADGNMYVSGVFTAGLNLTGPLTTPTYASTFCAQLNRLGPLGLPTDPASAVLTAYPNPVRTDGQLLIQRPTALTGPLSMVLFDLLGRRQVVQTLANGEAQGYFSLQGVAAGYYNLRVGNESATCSKRIVVE